MVPCVRRTILICENPLDSYANQNYMGPSPRRHEGRSASSRNVVRVAMAAAGVRCLHPTKRRRRTVKSCGPGAATLASIPACLCGPGNGGKRGRSPGRARSKPSNHCAGKAGMSWLYLSNPCAFLLPHCTRCCGCRRRPAFSAPSSRREQTKSQAPDENESRECEAASCGSCVSRRLSDNRIEETCASGVTRHGRRPDTAISARKPARRGRG